MIRMESMRATRHGLLARRLQQIHAHHGGAAAVGIGGDELADGLQGAVRLVDRQLGFGQRPPQAGVQILLDQGLPAQAHRLRIIALELGQLDPAGHQFPLQELVLFQVLQQRFGPAECCPGKAADPVRSTAAAYPASKGGSPGARV